MSLARAICAGPLNYAIEVGREIELERLLALELMTAVRRSANLLCQRDVPQTGPVSYLDMSGLQWSFGRHIRRR